MVAEVAAKQRAAALGQMTLGWTVDETAAALGVDRKSVYAAIARGEIEVERMGRRLIIKVPPLLKRYGASG